MTTDFDSTFDGSAKNLIGYDMNVQAAQQVYDQSGLGPSDFQVIELHDCFSANELLLYEALGLCGEGEAPKLIDNNDTTYGGRWVVNPSGGLISKGHPLGATGLAQCAELTWQLRGTADKRQVETSPRHCSTTSGSAEPRSSPPTSAPNAKRSPTRADGLAACRIYRHPCGTGCLARGTGPVRTRSSETRSDASVPLGPVGRRRAGEAVSRRTASVCQHVTRVGHAPVRGAQRIAGRDDREAAAPKRRTHVRARPTSSSAVTIARAPAACSGRREHRYGTRADDDRTRAQRPDGLHGCRRRIGVRTVRSTRCVMSAALRGSLGVPPWPAASSATTRNPIPASRLSNRTYARPLRPRPCRKTKGTP